MNHLELEVEIEIRSGSINSSRQDPPPKHKVPMDIPDIKSLQEIFLSKLASYENFVKLNPRVAAEVEAIIRWSSYLIATRKSPVFGEMLSTAANLLQLCNDIILRQSNPKLRIDLSSCATRLRTFLSVIQSLELLAEIYARDSYGAATKWAIITVIQLTKASIKLILLLVFDEGLTRSQSLVPLDRIHFSEITKLQEKFQDVSPEVEQEMSSSVAHQKPSAMEKQSTSIVLKSSGRKMRSLNEAPPKGSRFSQPSNSTETNDPFSQVQKERLRLLLERYREHESASLTERQLYGELLHITRPLAHLALMGTFGTKSWISYFTSLAMDLSSLHLVRSPLPGISGDHGRQVPANFIFNPNERLELGQRASSLLLYLLRSPFFDDFTKQRALDGISTAAESIPFFGHFLATFVNYIPDWQKDYFRVWSE